MKRIVQITALLILVCCLLSCSPFDFTEDASGNLNIDSGYCYEDLAIRVVVDDAHAYHVSWDVSIQYFKPRHGFYIYTPYVAEVDLKEAEYGRYYMEYSDFAVTGAPYEVYTEDLNYIVKVGDPNKTVTGIQKYTISYVCEVGADFSDALDILYWNIVGSFMDTQINNISFEVVLPHAIEKGSEAKLYQGGYGSPRYLTLKTEDGVSFKYENKNGLGSYNGLTLYLELPDGYYTDVSTPGILPAFLLIAVGIGTVLLCVFLYRKFGVDRTVLPTVEFEAPEGVDSAAAGYILDGSADAKDIVSLIFWFADHGYLTVEDAGADTFILHKKKELPDDAPRYLNSVFAGFFDGRDSVSTQDLNLHFYKTTQAAQTSLTHHWCKKIFDQKSSVMQVLSGFVSLIPFFFCVLWSICVSSALLDTGVIGLMLILVVAVGSGEFLLSRWVTSKSSYGFIKRSGMLMLSVLILLLSAFLFGWIIPAFVVDPWGISRWAGVFTMACLPFVMFAGRKTEEGEALFAKLCGFRTFIEKAEKERIEKMVAQDPAYFYHVLPYAYALGVTDQWAKRFEKITIEPPSWYSSSSMDAFTLYLFMSSFRRSAMVMNRSMVSRPEVKGSSGGGFSGGGGGFSGGGFGGGGGGSW